MHPNHYFTRPPAEQLIALSPDGSHWAELVNEGQAINLFLVQRLSGERTRITAFQERKVSSFSWVNNHRLIFTLNERDVLAINRDGSHPRTLTKSPAYVQVIHRWPENGDSILVAGNPDEFSNPDVYELNTLSGKYRRRHRGPREGFPERWFSTPEGDIKAAEVRTAEGLLLFRFDSASEQWSRLQTQRSYDRDVLLLSAPISADRALASIMGPAEPTGSVTRQPGWIDLADGQFTAIQQMPPLPGCCLAISDIHSGEPHWVGSFDPGIDSAWVPSDALQVALDALSDASDGRNVRPASRSDDDGYWILLADSALLEPDYFLWDSERHALSEIETAEGVRDQLASHRNTLATGFVIGPRRNLAFDMSRKQTTPNINPQRVDQTSLRTVTGGGKN